MKRLALTALAVAICLALGWMVAAPGPQAAVDAASKRELLQGYRQLAHRSYEAAYHSAGRLKTRIAALLAEPSESKLRQAQQAWREAHRDYSQTEAFRFGHWIVDEWETAVNAWPVDEGLLDYVGDPYAASPTNPLARHNLVSRSSIRVNGLSLDATRLDWAQLKFIHGGSDVEANVVLGYHAIEFLLWGQDRRQTEAGAGQRPWTDFADERGTCTSGPQAAAPEHCQRRRRLLQIMVEHLYQQLGDMALHWAGNSPTSYGLHIVSGDADEGLRRLLFSLIRLSGDEMAGERMQVALLTHAPEEEQDCFSDDTHQSAYHNALGIQNIYYGRHQNRGYKNGEGYQAAVSLAALARRLDAPLAERIEQALAETEQVLARIRQEGENGQPFDLLIQPGNAAGAQRIQQAITALQAESQLLEQLGERLALGPLNPRAASSEPAIR
ncbi:MAG: imelysin family protein [Pseudomonadota bacterium]